MRESHRESRRVPSRPPTHPSEAQPRARPLRDARTLRPGSSVVVGVLGGLAGLALLVPALLTEPRSWTLISTVVLALVLLWLFVVRPCAVIHAEGIRLVNPLRVVDVTWPAITEVRSRWALELVARAGATPRGGCRPIPVARGTAAAC